MGSVVLSVDAELCWGLHDLASPPIERIEGARTGWERLLSLFDRFDVPATWAIVGHLFLEECDGRHADHPTPPGWFAHERGRWHARPDLRFGPDLVRAVEEASAGHEIGSHTFSHVEFGAPGTSPELARAEVETALALAGERGISISSFVFPRNSIGHRDVLRTCGVDCYRGLAPALPLDGTPLRPLAKLARATVANGTPPLVTPSIDEYGLVDVPASLYCFSFEGRSRSLVEPVWGDPIVRQAKRGIDAATEGEGICHLWLHPNNLVHERDTERMAAILSYLADRRADTALSVETMGEVADRTRNGG